MCYTGQWFWCCVSDLFHSRLLYGNHYSFFSLSFDHFALFLNYLNHKTIINNMATNSAPSSHKIKRDLFHMNEMDLRFNKIVILSNQYKILEIRKRYSDGLDVCHRHTLNIVSWLESVLKLKKKTVIDLHFKTIKTAKQNILLKPISVSKSSMCVCPISKFCSKN